LTELVLASLRILERLGHFQTDAQHPDWGFDLL